MKEFTRSADAEARIAHINAHLSSAGPAVVNAAGNVSTGKGNPAASALSLASNAKARALQSWFCDADLAGLKKWSCTSARLQQLWLRMAKEPAAPGTLMLQLLMALLSNHPGLIGWLWDLDRLYDPARIEDPETIDFWAYQSIVALRGDWQRLAERCKKVEAAPSQSEASLYLVDNAFYSSLAAGDVNDMEAGMQAMLEPGVMFARDDDESGFTSGLIFTPAVIYAKIAWLHGHQVRVESPFIPAEWLPMEPLEQYESPYAFLD